jgi:predicted nucleic acid-binding protein
MAENALRIFLDTNVLISGFLSMIGAPHIILDLLTTDQNFLEAATGQYNINEMNRNRKRKYSKAAAVYDEYFPKLRLTIVPLPSDEETAAATWASGVASKDLAVLVSAACWRADLLITGDKRHLDRYKIEAGSPNGEKSSSGIPFRIVSPAELVDDVLPGIFRELLRLRRSP